ncbi:MAG: hypothetical protein KDK24_04430 [Pseudooceanicola sp.]|nr:hypothetical protein [Pseudooceanicola sp.]
MNHAALISPLLLLGCTEAPTGAQGVFLPEYQGVETRLLDTDLVQIRVQMTGARDRRDVTAYATCAAAQYALIRGYGFARHLRTNFDEKGGVSGADAVYTVSPTLPAGLKTIDAEVTVAACKNNGIPTV